MGRSYFKVTEVTDFGPFVTKLILPIRMVVKTEALKPEFFNVYVERKKNDGEILMLPKNWHERHIKVPSKGYCTVKNVYASDRFGDRREEGNFVALELKAEPLGLTSTIAAPDGMNEFIISDFRITQIAEIAADDGVLSGIVFDRCAGETMKQAEHFLHGISSFAELPLKYGYFHPQTGNGRRPLMIWLHGGGEGGQDPTIAYAGNKVVNLASEEIQAKFGGAFVLVPQAPTFWMDDGSGQYGRSGKTKYGVALKALIDEFIANHDTAIDRDRIYIGGCSNGGFMTMRMLIDYPNFFAAAYPVCEALYDEVIAESDIEAIKNVPIWFTHAKEDDVVNPEETAVPTYHRLIQAGAKDVHFSYFDKVIDLYDQFTNEDGSPYIYHDHFAWVYALNDDCRLDFDGNPVVVNGKEVSLMDWLSMQRKSSLNMRDKKTVRQNSLS